MEGMPRGVGLYVRVGECRRWLGCPEKSRRLTVQLCLQLPVHLFLLRRDVTLTTSQRKRHGLRAGFWMHDGDACSDQLRRHRVCGELALGCLVGRRHLRHSTPCLHRVGLAADPKWCSLGRLGHIDAGDPEVAGRLKHLLADRSGLEAARCLQHVLRLAQFGWSCRRLGTKPCTELWRLRMGGPRGCGRHLAGGTTVAENRVHTLGLGNVLFARGCSRLGCGTAWLRQVERSRHRT